MTSIDSYKLTFDSGIVKDISLSKYDRTEYTSASQNNELLNIEKPKQNHYELLYRIVKDTSLSKYDRTEYTGARQDNELLNIERPKQIKYNCKNPELGIQKIELNETSNKVILQGSAKVLRDDYYQGINTNTWGRVIDSYNNTGLINLDPVEVFNNAELFSVDISDNLKMEHHPSKYIETLKLLNVNERYHVTDFRNRGKKVNGITFQGKQRTFKERQIMYEKLAEILTIPELRKYAGEYSNVLRVEMNLQQLRRISHYFGSNKLCDVLTSENNANYQLFEKINSKASVEVLKLFKESEGMTLSTFEKQVGRETIIEKYCLENWDTVNDFIRSKQKSRNPSRKKKEYRETYIRLKEKKLQGGKILQLNNPLIDELIYKLKVA